MPKSAWIEVAGYIGSALVLVSFLMTSVVKLRLVNMMGSLISCTYALIIGSYPLALMNFALILINLFFLWKMKHAKKDYRVMELTGDSPLIADLLQRYGADIEACFPGISRQYAPEDPRFLLFFQDEVAGLTIVHREGDTAHLLLDYSLPKYRDYSLGQFLAGELRARGFARLSYAGPDVNHLKYLGKLDYTRDEQGRWIKVF